MQPTLQRIIMSPQGIVKKGLVGWYKFNEAVDSQVLVDYSGRNNNGQNGSAVGADTNDATFDGIKGTFATDDYITGGTNAAFNVGNSNYTLVVVIKPTTANLEGIMGKLIFNTNEWGLFQNANKFSYQSRGSDAATGLVSNSNYALNVPVCVIARRSINTQHMFINAVKQNASATITTEPDTAAKPFIIGTRTTLDNYYFNGDFYYALVYNIALSDNQIKQTYKAIQKELAKRGVTI